MTPVPSRPLLAKYRRERNGKAEKPALPQAAPRSRIRRMALLIMALIPIAVGAWVMSIMIPTAYETWRASEDIFDDRTDRPGLADQAPDAPTAMPESVQALLTATAEGTPASSFSTQIPIGVVPDDRTIPTPSSNALAGADDDRPTATEAGEVRSATGVPPTATATFEPLPAWNGTDPVNILLLGVDTRPSESSDGRSDTMIVVHVDPAAKRVDMFSIPRDLAVTIPGFGTGYKINSAYPWGESSEIDGGGPRLIMDTIELNFGITIDHYATVDIPGLEQIIDTVGGVVVDVDTQLKDDQYPTEDFGYTRAYFRLDSSGWTASMPSSTPELGMRMVISAAPSASSRYSWQSGIAYYSPESSPSCRI
ncbi:MAG: LCP family protein [Thermomicrobiales bacterium]